jgi:hypothetical protein
MAPISQTQLNPTFPSAGPPGLLLALVSRPLFWHLHLLARHPSANFIFFQMVCKTLEVQTKSSPNNLVLGFFTELVFWKCLKLMENNFSFISLHGSEIFEKTQKTVN